jgi:hypothetical protein
MPQTAIFQSSDPYEHQRSIRADAVELVVTGSRSVSRRSSAHRRACVFRSKSARHSDVMSAGNSEVKSAVPI